MLEEGSASSSVPACAAAFLDQTLDSAMLQHCLCELVASACFFGSASALQWLQREVELPNMLTFKV